MRPHAFGALLVLAACSHPEDRRWAKLISAPPPNSIPKPKLSVYSFASPADQKQALSVKDLSGEGQAAYIALLNEAKDGAAFRKSVSAPIAAGKGLSATAKPTLDRTVVIGVQKDPKADVGDRLMRTVVTIIPHSGQFEFAGYSIVATDNEVQSIAHLDTKTESSLDVTLAPNIHGFGDNKVEGKVDHTKETSADVSQQYEKLNVDIEPGRIVITRESERGLDVVGNTIVKASIVPTPPPGLGSGVNVFLVSDQTLFKNGAVLKPADASLDMDTFGSPLKCKLEADVTMGYRERHIVNGTEYYTEGKQDIQLVDDAVEPTTVDLVRADETAPDLWQIVVGDRSTAILAHRVDNTSRILAFNNYEAAQTFAYWLRKTGATTVGKDGITLSAGGQTLLNADVHADVFRHDCVPVPAKAATGATASPAANS